MSEGIEDFVKDVHTEHCCIIHGCKYMDDNCTVTTLKAPQSFLCEDCNSDQWEQVQKEMFRLQQGKRITEDVIFILTQLRLNSTFWHVHLSDEVKTRVVYVLKELGVN